MIKVLRFTASWCGPCKALAPIVETVKGDIPVDVIDIDEESNIVLATKFIVRGVPTLVMLDDDKEVKRLVGMTSKDKLNEWFHG
jgi:thioredoxin 1